MTNSEALGQKALFLPKALRLGRRQHAVRGSFLGWRVMPSSSSQTAWWGASGGVCGDGTAFKLVLGKK